MEETKVSLYRQNEIKQDTKYPEIKTIEEEIESYLYEQKVRQHRMRAAASGDISGYFEYESKINGLEVILLNQKAERNE
jgi:hypothetical protein